MSKKPAKVKDKLRDKTWYKIVAPPYFGAIELQETPANTPEQILGRTIETTLYEVTNDITHQSTHLKLIIEKTEGDKAITGFKGHELARDYLRSLIRRGTSRIDGIVNVITKDGRPLRVAVTAFTTSRAKTTQEMGVRRVMHSVVRARSAELNFDEFVQQMVLGKIASDVYNESKKITPLRKIEVRKSKLGTLSRGRAAAAA
jgi:small subunit ribosomal protein S3Ae